MPRQQGYGTGQAGYGNQYGRSRQHAQVTGEYESAFNPIPIEFLQDQLRGRQTQYDTAFAGALEQQDAMAQQQVGMADIAAKNELIQTGMGNIDKIVEEKYGGDWGRASKEVARHITQIRSDPFWNAQAEVEKKRTAYETRASELGARGMQFGVDPRQLSTIDPETGQVRSQDQFTGQVVEQGQWGETARDIFSSLTSDVYQDYGLEEGDLQGYIRGDKVDEVTRKKIEKMAEDPAVQLAFQQAHPEFVQGFHELDDRQKQKFGLEGETLEEVTRKTLLGNIAPAVHRKQTSTLMVDKYQLEDYQARLEGGTQANRYIPSTNQLAVTANSTEALDQHRAMVKQQGLPGHTEDDKLSDVFGYSSNPIASPEEKAAFEAKQEQNRNLYHQELLNQFPYLEGKPRDEVFDIVDKYYENESQKSRNVYNLHLEDSGTNMTNNLMSNIGAGNFEALSLQNATGDVTGERNIVDALGFKDYPEMIETMKDLKIAPRIDFSQGKIVIDMPTNAKQKGLFKGRKEGMTSLYYSPDLETQDVLDSGQAINEMYRDPNNYGTPVVKGQPLKFDRNEQGQTTVNGSPLIHIPNGRGGHTGDAVFVVGTGNIETGNDKTIYVIDTENPQAEPRVISQEQLNTMLTEQVDVRWNNYEGPTGNVGKEK